MKIKDLKLFIKVVELGSFTAAASALEVPRANVSRRISDLENTLNIRLFQRTTRQLSLTQNGEAYYKELLIAIEALDRANTVGLSLSDTPKGKIRIGIQPETDVSLQPMLFSFQDIYPDIEIDVRIISNGLVEISKLNLDLVFHVGSIENNNFVARKITSIEKYLTATPAYIEQNGLLTRRRDLSSYHCISYRWPNDEVDELWQIGDKRVKINSKLTSNNVGFVKRAVLQDRGIGFLPSLMIKDELTSGELIHLLPQHQTVKEHIYLLYPSRSSLTHACRLLIDHLLIEIPNYLKLSLTSD